MKSPRTTILGSASIVLTLIHQAVQEQGIPQTASDWIVLLTGIVTGVALILAKDGNKTHAQQANAQPHDAPIVNSPPPTKERP